MPNGLCVWQVAEAIHFELGTNLNRLFAIHVVNYFNFWIMKRYRLNKIKRIRKLRDKLLQTDNVGRCTTLLMKMPNVSAYGRDCYDHYYGSGRRINLWLKGGYEHTFAGYESLLHYAKEAGKFAYMEWVKNYCS